MEETDLIKPEVMSKIKELALKIPADFDDLCDLKSIAAQAQLIDVLKSNMSEYYASYVQSQLKTMEQVLEYVAESERHKYVGIDDMQSGILYMVDVINKEVIQIPGNSRTSGNQVTYWSGKFEFNEDYTVLTYSRKYETHSPFSRHWDPIILSAYTIQLTFDVRNNTFAGMKRIKHK